MQMQSASFILAALNTCQAAFSHSLVLPLCLSPQTIPTTSLPTTGTGKTTVARRVGSLFMSLGILASDQVVECSAGDFVTGYVNQAAGKTREMFERALGGVLFIDEAYR